MEDTKDLGEPTTTVLGNSPHAPAHEATTPSSSSLDRQQGELSIMQANAIPPAVLTELVDQAAKILTGNTRVELPGKIRAAIEAGNPVRWIRDALVDAKRSPPRSGGKRHWGIVLGILRNYRTEDRPREELAAHPAVPPAPEENRSPRPRDPEPPPGPEEIERMRLFKEALARGASVVEAIAAAGSLDHALPRARSNSQRPSIGPPRPPIGRRPRHLFGIDPADPEYVRICREVGWNPPASQAAAENPEPKAAP